MALGLGNGLGLAVGLGLSAGLGLAVAAGLTPDLELADGDRSAAGSGLSDGTEPEDNTFVSAGTWLSFGCWEDSAAAGSSSVSADASSDRLSILLQLEITAGKTRVSNSIKAVNNTGFLFMITSITIYTLCICSIYSDGICLICVFEDRSHSSAPQYPGKCLICFAKTIEDTKKVKGRRSHILPLHRIITFVPFRNSINNTKHSNIKTLHTCMMS
jgi:hypothetical protein